MDELTLVLQAAKGDHSAFEQLVLTYQKPVYNLALRMTGNAEDANDLAQEAFLNAWRGLPNFKFDSSFSTWIYRLTSNACISFLRQRKRRSTVSAVYLDDENEEQEFSFPDPAPQPEEKLIRQEEHDLVREALESLEPEYREALSMSVFAGQSYAQIAEILGVKEGTVKSRISRAREKIRKKLLQSGNKFGSVSSNDTKGGD